MAPKATKNRTPSPDPNGIFAGMCVFLVENGVQTRPLQIWKQKLVQMGAAIDEKLSKKVTHVFAMNLKPLLQQVSRERLARFKGCYTLSMAGGQVEIKGKGLRGIVIFKT